MSESIIRISSERLKVEISKPGAVYSGPRFDWTGFVTQMTLDGRHTFCVPESLKPGQGSGGQGLCNEFGIMSAIGYDDCEPGEKFPKIGVGLLTKPDSEPYDFFRLYRTEPFKVDTVNTASSVRFTVKPAECRGYAVELVKTLSVEGNSLVTVYSLKNCGKRPVHTHEYCHNFVGIDGHTVGPDYQLTLPCSLKAQNISPVLDVTENKISWSDTPVNGFYCRTDSFKKGEGSNWELIHGPSGVGVREYGDFPVLMFALWGEIHVISPEVFVDISIQTGETFTWTRRHEFFC